MLEALVTLLIVSLGLLGIAGIIANSLKVNQGAQIRSQASWLANNIIDSMRANRTTAEKTPAAYTLGNCAAIPIADPIAQADLTQWCAAVAAALPAGTGALALVVNPATATALATVTATVTVQWDDTRAAGGVVDQQFVVETRL